MVKLGPMALFSSFQLTSSSGKHLEDISHAHIFSLMYKLITSAKDSDDLSIGFDRDRNRRRNKLTNNKNVKSTYHLRKMLRNVFGFREQQEKVTYGLGYEITLTRYKDDAVLQKAIALAEARIKIDQTHWYVPHYKPSIQPQSILSKRILSKTPTELRYIERSVYERSK